MKVWRPERCAICRKPREHESHRVPKRPGLLYRLVHLAWPRWIWGLPAGVHEFQDDAPRAASVETMHRLRERQRKRKRAQLP